MFCFHSSRPLGFHVHLTPASFALLPVSAFNSPDQLSCCFVIPRQQAAAAAAAAAAAVEYVHHFKSMQDSERDF